MSQLRNTVLGEFITFKVVDNQACPLFTHLSELFVVNTTARNGAKDSKKRTFSICVIGVPAPWRA